MRNDLLVNIGCGTVHHPAWVNLDVVSTDPSVIQADILNGLPFADDTVTACYSSHVLEHLEKAHAVRFLKECRRVLKSGGIVRIVVPDLESITREYLRVLDSSLAEGGKVAREYDWIVLEMLDQMVRNRSGGEMADFLKAASRSDIAYAVSRVGAEAERVGSGQMVGDRPLAQYLNRYYLGRALQRVREMLAGLFVYLLAGGAALRGFKLGLFRASGEIHQWMYDRYSLQLLLEQAGFADIRVCSAAESRIPDFASYSLDTSGSGVRKPDSLFMEATKP